MSKSTNLPEHTKEFLVACAQGNFDLVKKHAPFIENNFIDQGLCVASTTEKIDIVKYLLSHPVPKDTNALACAIEVGCSKIVKCLLPFTDPSLGESEALRIASQKGHADIVKSLLPYSEAKYRQSEALALAALGGGDIWTLLKFFRPTPTPKAADSRALTYAATNGRLECVKYLLPLSDPKANESIALACAAMGGGIWTW